MIPPEKGKPYFNPVLAGVALGIVVTAAFAAGHYFGASRVFTQIAKLLRGDEVQLDHWMNLEVLGLFLGGLIGSLLARRFVFKFEKGASVPTAARIATAIVGGVLVMIGSRFAAGCTSGLALSGGVQMSMGAFVFMGTMFAGGFLAAAFARRLWS